MKTVVGLFDTFDEARRAAMDLEAAQIPHNDISIVANNEGGQYATQSGTSDDQTDDYRGHAIGHDAIVGAEIGGVAGLLIGMTGLAIPGLGWVATAGWLGGLLLGAGTGAVIGGLVGALTHVGVPEEDAYHYNEAVRRGGVLLAVRVDDARAHEVATILGNDGAVNIDERAEQFRQEGFLPGPSALNTPVTPANPIAQAAHAVEAGIAQHTPRTGGVGEVNRNIAANEGTVLPVVEENLAVGKRQVERGGVRVYSHITERPVEEQVKLREEHVVVERHPVNRPADAATLQNLKEGSIEVTERAEVPVVSKEARVVEEVVVGKQATEHTETVRDTVRRTDVEVEQLPKSK